MMLPELKPYIKQAEEDIRRAHRLLRDLVDEGSPDEDALVNALEHLGFALDEIEKAKA